MPRKKSGAISCALARLGMAGSASTSQRPHSRGRFARRMYEDHGRHAGGRFRRETRRYSAASRERPKCTSPRMSSMLHFSSPRATPFRSRSCAEKKSSPSMCRPIFIRPASTRHWRRATRIRECLSSSIRPRRKGALSTPLEHLSKLRFVEHANPSFFAFSNLLPASSPASTKLVFLLTLPLTFPPARDNHLRDFIARLA